MDLSRDPASASDRPDVTVVIPTHDRPKLLQRAAQSVLHQSFGDLELLVVDDGSTEATRVESQDPRVRVVRLEQPAGVSAARNFGLQRARGRWVVFLDDDDELLPEMVRISREAVLTSRRPAPVSALSGIALVSAAGETIEERLPISLDRGKPYLLAGDMRVIQDANTLFAPTETLRAIGGWNEAFKAWENDDLFLRLSRVSSIEGIPQVAYRMHHHDAPRLSRDAWAMIRGAERTLREYREAFDACPKRRAMYLARMAALYLDVGEWGRAVSALFRSLWLDPAAPRAVPRLLVGLGGPHMHRLTRAARRRLGTL